jgi:chromosomal replication initiation ATPase DnaA
MQFENAQALQQRYAAARNRLTAGKRADQPKRDWLVVETKTVVEAPGLKIMREVCEKHGVAVSDIVSRRRTKDLVLPRHEIMWRIRHETPASLPQIGRLMRRDHTSVYHGIRKYEAYRAKAGEA